MTSIVFMSNTVNWHFERICIFTWQTISGIHKIYLYLCMIFVMVHYTTLGNPLGLHVFNTLIWAQWNVLWLVVNNLFNDWLKLTWLPLPLKKGHNIFIFGGGCREKPCLWKRQDLGAQALLACRQQIHLRFVAFRTSPTEKELHTHDCQVPCETVLI